MASEQSWQKLNKRIVALGAFCFAFALLNFVLSTQALAHERTGGPTFQVKAGFESHYRDGNWVPVQAQCDAVGRRGRLPGGNRRGVGDGRGDGRDGT